MARVLTDSKILRKEEFYSPGLNQWDSLRQAHAMAGTLHIHLRAHRKRTKLTQEQVANILGKSHSTISHWEAGTRALDLQDLEALAKLYGVHPVALLMAPEDGPRADAIRQASDLAKRMEGSALADWLKLGAHLAPAETFDTE